MRKNIIRTTQAVLAAGIIGAFIRLWEVLTIFDPITGLAQKYAMASILLTVLSLLVTVKIVWSAISFVNKGGLKINLNRPFPVRNNFSMIVHVVLGAIIALSSALNFVLDVTETIAFKGIFAVLGIVSGVAIALSAKASYRREEKIIGTLACIPALFMCFWLVMTYKENNTNPVILEYCYKCIAIAVTTLSFYYAAGHYYGKPTPKLTIITHFLSAYFCLVTYLDAGNIAQSVIFIALAILQFINGCAYIRGMPKKKIEE